jgi:hypothetical protein
MSGCTICDYWKWRLKDLQISRDKDDTRHREAQLVACTSPSRVGIYNDIASVRKSFNEHGWQEHKGHFEAAQ